MSCLKQFACLSDKKLAITRYEGKLLMKKLISFLLILTMLFIVITACGEIEAPIIPIEVETEEGFENVTTLPVIVEPDEEISKTVKNNEPNFIEEPMQSPDIAIDNDTAVIELIERLSFDMWEPYITLSLFEIPEYVENNAYTRLAMRWPDYHLAEIVKRPGSRLISIDSINVSIQEGQVPIDGFLTVRGMSEIRYTRLEPSVNGVNVEYSLVIDTTGETLKIVSIDMIFNSNYRSMKEEIDNRLDGDEPTIEIIDSVVNMAIKNIR